MTATDWLSATAALIAVLISLIALRYARSSAKSAEVAAASSATSADAASRSADVAEREEQRRLQDAAENAVRWTLTPLSAGVAALTNVGEGIAYEVRIEADPSMHVAGLSNRRETIPKGSMMRVGVAVDLDTFDDTVTVLWRDSPGGDERRWSHPAP